LLAMQMAGKSVLADGLCAKSRDYGMKSKQRL
jgi:hypothetical protein